MSGLQTVLMLHGRKEPVLYTQHSVMMLHAALKYGSKKGDCCTYWRESCRRKPHADHIGEKWIGKPMKWDFDDKYIKNPWVYHLLREMAVEYTIWLLNDTYIIDGLLSNENYGKTDDFYFVKRLLSRAWVRIISAYQRAVLSDEAVCVVHVEQQDMRKDWMIYTVSIKLIRKQGSIQQYNT